MELSPQKDIYYIDTVSPLDYFIDTVTPSAIQLNKEKIMSIELDGPLYLGSNSMQQQVDQNTADIEDLKSDVASIEDDIGSLDNLATSDKSSIVNAINETLSVLDPTQTADYIKNSKGLESGEISTNASILPWVEEMSHSTFDLSKFTVVGSPNITDDGVLSNVESNNYVYKTIAGYSYNISNHLYTIRARMKYYTPTGGDDILFALPSFWFMYDKTNTRFLLTGGKVGGGNAIFAYNTQSLNDGDIVDIIVNFSATTINYSYRINNGSWVQVNGSGSPTLAVVSTLNLYLGKNPYGGQMSKIELDLKYLDFKIDGVPVFSGNKTGLDVIKLNDYTIVGSPSITFNGVARGFSSGNYITKSITTSSYDIVNKKYEVCFKSIYNLNSGDTNTTQMYFGMNYKIWCYYDVTNSRLDLYGAKESGGNVLLCRISSLTLSNNDVIEITANVTQGSQFLKCVVNGTEHSATGSVSNMLTSTDNSITLFIGTNTYGYLTSGSIDLNTVKTYVNDNLVYQPCLRIPYAEGKTGSKVVNAIYRDRVNDMYEQFGYAPYYTLDTTNSNYTIPKGEVYGMVNKVVPTLIAPDYSKPVSLTYSSGLVMDNDGWLEVQIQSSEATANPYVSINGSIICRTSVNSNGDLNRDTAMMVVRKGDVITSGGYTDDTAIVLTYYPFKV